MRLVLLTVLVLIAFAANSLLNRAALASGTIDPMTFAVLRVSSGALALALLVLYRERKLSLHGAHRMTGVLSLSLYILGFSLAYVALDAGVGALILFGCVQVTMFVGAVVTGERVPTHRWLGMCLALIGLCWLMWPSGPVHLSLPHIGWMIAAAIGWGVYSLIGRTVGDPLRATAANFILATPLCIAVFLVILILHGAPHVQTVGVLLALVSGVVTSALGYALWYKILPSLPASIAAIAQLTVPVIAIVFGLFLLDEILTGRTVFSSILILGGVALAVFNLRLSSVRRALRNALSRRRI